LSIGGEIICFDPIVIVAAPGYDDTPVRIQFEGIAEL
jgi:hypothetical protein